MIGKYTYSFIGFLSFFSSTHTIQVAFKEGTIKRCVNEALQVVKEGAPRLGITEWVADVIEQGAEGVGIGLERAVRKGVFDGVIHLFAKKGWIEFQAFKKETREHMLQEMQNELWTLFRYGGIAAVVVVVPLAGYYAYKAVWPVFRKKVIRKSAP